MRRLTSGKHVVEWVAKQTNEYGDFGSNVGIGLQKYVGPHWETIAGVVYANWNGPNVECHIASDGSRHWMTKGFLWRIFHYPFEELGCKRLTVCVGEGNANSRRFVENLGFTVEAELENAHPTGNLLIYRLKKSDCRFLGIGPMGNEESHADSHQSRLAVAA